ncbi:MAG TPA: GNAT family N-acetyltransferase [Isosphaeraceae bacterium]|nr:GNAT family N-acetyltransferase [Isosphaeraceae bacterium]
MKLEALDVQLPYRRGSVEFCAGTEADHEAVYQTLLHVFHGPDRESFLGALSEPAYRPDQRLLVKVEGRIVSHLHLTERVVRYGSSNVSLNGVMWVGTLPEYRGLGFAQNLMRVAERRARDQGITLQTLTTSMPQFYRPLGWGVCGKHSFAQTLSRNLPPWNETATESRGGAWHVRPWRQVELGDLMALYDRQFARTTGTVVRSEDYWRWLIGRRYAHVIWVACQGETVRGYAFVKDHRILEVATDPAFPPALKLLIARVRSEALERAYPEVTVHAPPEHPVLEIFRQASGRVIDQEEWEGSSTMYHIPTVEGFLQAICPELAARARLAGAALPLELGLSTGEKRWLVRVKASGCRVEPDKLSRRHLKLTPSALVRLCMGHSGIDQALAEEGAEASASTAVDAARILFPIAPIWRSPLDSATA